MVALLFTLGIAWIGTGSLFVVAAAVAAAQSTNPPANAGVMGALLLSFGVAFLALATGIDRLEAIKKALQR